MPELPIDPPLPNITETPEARAERARKPLVCEFCGCALAPNGDVLKRGETATVYMKQADEIVELQEQLDKAREDGARIARERDDARAELAGKQKKASGFWS